MTVMLVQIKRDKNDGMRNHTLSLSQGATEPSFSHRFSTPVGSFSRNETRRDGNGMEWNAIDTGKGSVPSA